MSSSGPAVREFQIEALLSKGSSGRIYRAVLREQGQETDVAVKLISDEDVDRLTLARLRQEASRVALLKDRAVVGVDPPIRLGDHWALVMDLVTGVSLQRLTSLGPMPISVTAEIVQEVARVLEKAWSSAGPTGKPLKILHRDIKPSNLQLNAAGELRILDFGIAKADFATRGKETANFATGTRVFVSPERVEGKDTPAGDIYSLGVTAHVLLGDDRAITEDDDDETALADATTQALLALVSRMRSEDPRSRPDASEVEQRCARIRRRAEGVTLAEWAAHNVPRAIAVRFSDRVVGKTLVETNPPSPSSRRSSKPPRRAHNTTGDRAERRSNAPSSRSRTSPSRTPSSRTSQTPSSRASSPQAPAPRTSSSQAPSSRAPSSRAPASREPSPQGPSSRAPASRSPSSRSPSSRAPSSQAPDARSSRSIPPDRDPSRRKRTGTPSAAPILDPAPLDPAPLDPAPLEPTPLDADPPTRKLPDPAPAPLGADPPTRKLPDSFEPGPSDQPTRVPGATPPLSPLSGNFKFPEGDKDDETVIRSRSDYAAGLDADLQPAPLSAADQRALASATTYLDPSKRTKGKRPEQAPTAPVAPPRKRHDGVVDAVQPAPRRLGRWIVSMFATGMVGGSALALAVAAVMLVVWWAWPQGSDPVLPDPTPRAEAPDIVEEIEIAVVDNAPPPPLPNGSRLTFSSIPLGADVYIDRKPVGPTPVIAVTVNEGEHEVILVSDFEHIRRKIVVGRRKPQRFVWKGGDVWERHRLRR